jgi:2-methylcitrate dehydratase PrpD
MVREGSTERLADLSVRVRYRDLPNEVIQKGKECILDTLGCMLAGCRGTEARILLKYLEGAGGRPEATVIGFGKKTNAPNAALVNGTLGHALDFDDSQHSLMGHPSVVILPAVLSLGEKMKSSGEAMLEAFILGFEVTCKVGRGVNPKLYENGWHATSVIGTLGASVAAGKLLGLDSGKMASALGLSASLACGLRENFGTMTKPFHVGKAAENGVLSALLVKDGFTASQQILEAKRGFCAAFSGQYDLNQILDDFGHPFEIVSPGVHLKPYPSCLETHSVIEATLFLVESHDIQPEDVESVECGIAPLAMDILIHRNPQTGLQGKFSAPYAVTAALLHRKASLEQFTDQAVQDVRAQAMNQKVNVVAHPEMEKNVQSAIVTIRLKNGREFTKRLDITTGHPKRPMSLNQIIEKYRSCADSMISKDKIAKSIEKVLSFEALTDIGELIDLTVNGKELTGKA